MVQPNEEEIRKAAETGLVIIKYINLFSPVKLSKQKNFQLNQKIFSGTHGIIASPIGRLWE